MSAWGDARDAVRHALDGGWPLANIEAWLLDELPDEHAAALWLYAWSYQELTPHRRTAARTRRPGERAEPVIENEHVIVRQRPVHPAAPPSP